MPDVDEPPGCGEARELPTPEPDGPDQADESDEADEPAGAPRLVTRRRLLTSTVIASVVAATSVFAAEEASSGYRHRKRPTDRVAPRPETVQAFVGTDVVWRGAPTEPVVALTFDDGPDPRWTPLAMAALDEVGGKATFFQLGDAVRAHPGLAREVLAAGHEIGNHGTGHLDLTDLEGDALRDNVLSAHEAIAEATGTAPLLLRPPWGRIDSPSLFVAAGLGYRVALWSHHLPTDGAEKKVDRNVATASPGMIVLCHDGRSTPADSLFVAVRRLLAELTDAGYRFTTVSELLALSTGAPAHSSPMAAVGPAAGRTA